ncbi:alcohol dehydrogenase class-3-like [Dorcoceras hygrometricum]|uniref:Alcohol dehydrogenase class-3-like n=1 Tax=Dorcoceras hygrometricum TaxID=472368 RepID=A0A2Z7D5S8_9LAMI|nr:alcohol dehydrogenase class-3-like [Dorcoceras hygrometricum]
MSTPLEYVVGQSSQGSGQSSGWGSSHEDPYKRFRHKQKLKLQASQLKDRRSSKRPKTDQQKPLWQRHQSLNSVPKISNKPSCPKCRKKHAGQCRAGQGVCYKFCTPGQFVKECPLLKQLTTGGVCVMTAYQVNPDTTEVTGNIMIVCVRSIALVDFGATR